MNEGSRYALYFVPPADSALYQFGSSVLGYDCYTGGTLTRPDELVRDARAWHSMVDEPRRYGFHATLKAPFHLSSACTEMQLLGALQNFAASGHVIPVIDPVIRMLSGFAAILSQQLDPSLDALAANCTKTFDSFRAPISPQERTRRIAAGLSQAQVKNLDQWGYPFVFADFRFHMTLTGRIPPDAREAAVALLRRSFERLCGYGAIPVDRLALLKQESSDTAFQILSHAQLRPPRA
jgi:Protein of unknown function (DUF1045)